MAEKEKDIGALWIKNGNAGQYMTGSIEVAGQKVSIVCFINKHKKEAKHPDWRIFVSQPSERSSERQDRAFDRAFDAGQEPKPQSTGIVYPGDEINPDDIPF